MVGETWLTAEVPSSFVSVHCFNIVRGDTGGLVRKHGVCLYINDGLSFEEVVVAVPNIAAVHLIEHDVWILAVYRPPSYCDNENEVLLDFIEDFCSGREVVVLGDFNLPSVQWSAGGGVCRYASRTDRLFVDCFVSAGLYQWIEEATFVSSDNTLDLFLTSELDRVGSVEILACFPRCKHSPMVCSYWFSFNQGVEQGNAVGPAGFSWHRGRYVSISGALSSINWEVELLYPSVDGAYEYLCDVLIGLVNEFVPRNRGVKGAPWSVRPPAALKQERREAWIAYRSAREIQGRHGEQAIASLEIFQGINHRFRHYCLNSRALYESSLMNRYGEAPKLFHSYIRKKKVGCLSVGPLRLPGESLLVTPVEMANVLVSTFSSVFVERVPVAPAPYQTCNSHMDDFVIEPNEVYKVLLGLDANSAMGPDNVHPRLLKSCAEELTVPLTIIFNLSIATGSLPSRWLESLVMPLFKGKSRLDPHNYRPVSLTSVCCKVLERIVVARLMAYLESYGILSDRQFGFRKARSTEDQMLLVYSRIAELVDAGLVVDVGLLDFSKAFDVVSHPVLIDKLSSLGVSPCLVGWVGAFLAGRTMRVTVDGVCSESRSVTSGVPQGSVLGPVLFLVYVNCLTDGLRSDFVAFADDYKIFLHYHRQEVLDPDGMACLQADLNIFHDVACSWNLSLNPGKCVIMRFTRHFAGWDSLGNGATYHLGGSRLEFVESHRDLGVVVDTTLRFHHHVRSVVQKAAGLSSNLLRSTVNRHPDFMVTLFVTHVRPLLDYCSTVWCVGYSEDLHLLESVQRRWTKRVEGMSGLHYGARLRALDLFSVRGRFIRSDLIKYWKILCTDAGGYDLSAMFQRSLNENARGHRHRLLMPHCVTDMRKKFFNVRNIMLWNSLPSEVVGSASVSGFKSSLASFLGNTLFEY